MMRSNLAIALLCLLLGAALADWLSTRDANAQALPPSSGGTSYTHPSAISLPNGIDSQDGGTLNGPVYVDDTMVIDGGAGIQFLGPVGGAGAPYVYASGFFELQCKTGAAADNCEWKSYKGTFTGPVTNGLTSGDAFIAAGGAYSRVLRVSTGAPAAGDCDNAGESGRAYYRTDTDFLYICPGAGGWKSLGPFL